MIIIKTVWKIYRLMHQEEDVEDDDVLMKQVKVVAPGPFEQQQQSGMLPGYMRPKTASSVSPSRMDRRSKSPSDSSAANTSSNSSKKTKLVPKVPVSTSKSGARNTGLSEDHLRESWGEGGFYHDGAGNQIVGSSPVLKATSTASELIKSEKRPVAVGGGSPAAAERQDSPGQQQSTEDEYATLQLDREREFMGVLIGSLDMLPDDIMEGLYDELFQHLRSKLSDALLAVMEPMNTPDEFDAAVVAILSSDEFVNSMVETRDGLFDYIQSHMDEEESVKNEKVAVDGSTSAP